MIMNCFVDVVCDIFAFIINDTETNPKTVTSIETSAFENCLLLESFVFKEGIKLKSIPRCMFTESGKLKTIKIPKNSSIKSIGSDAFADGKIKDLYNPMTVEKLKKGWCTALRNLVNVTVSPLNKSIKNCESNNKLILGKSDKNNDSFDVVVFACRDIKYAKIPKNIKTIGDYSFQLCNQLETIQFEENSELQSIGIQAFAFSNLKSIIVPKNVRVIEDSIFDETNNFTSAELLADEMRLNETFSFKICSI